MRFLVDECTGPKVSRWLASIGHEVFSVYHQGRGLDDQTILRKAAEEQWILITSDSDFGEMVHHGGYAHRGIIFLRLKNQQDQAKIKALSRLLSGERLNLADQFVVVTEASIRIARPRS